MKPLPAGPGRIEMLALRAALAVPVLYFGSVLLGILTYPGFDPLRQFASELGAEGAPHPRVLNVGVILAGAFALVAVVGFAFALHRLSARPIPARLACYATATLGLALIVAGAFPMPNLLHMVGSAIGLPVLAAPMLLAAALRPRPDTSRLRRFLLINNLLMFAALIAFLSATGTRLVGLCQFLYTLTAVPWLAVAAHALSRSPTCLPPNTPHPANPSLQDKPDNNTFPGAAFTPCR
jgi:hypothetical membrane protein